LKDVIFVNLKTLSEDIDEDWVKWFPCMKVEKSG